DVTGGGKADLVGRDPGTGQWWVGTSTGAGFADSVWGQWSPQVTWTDVRLADVTGDGLPDLVGRDPTTGTWWVGVSQGRAFQTSAWGQWTPQASWVDVRTGQFG